MRGAQSGTSHSPPWLCGPLCPLLGTHCLLPETIQAGALSSPRGTEIVRYGEEHVLGVLDPDCCFTMKLFIDLLVLSFLISIEPA